MNTGGADMPLAAGLQYLVSMPSDVLPPPEEKAAAVQQLFDRIAPRYDRVNRVMTGRMDQRWRHDLLERLEVTDDDIVLDLACGTGDFAEIAREHTRHVIGVDFARKMLEGAKARRLLSVELVQGDALNLPLGTGSVTVAVSGFALRNFTSLEPVFAELARVVRPGGRIGLLEVDTPRNPIVRLGHGIYFNRIVPFIGGIISGDLKAYRYLPASAAYLPPERELVRMLQRAGFKHIRKKRPMLGAIQSLTAVRA
jgi:demethylmenaquinone methyltransferase/2-methoxy-6-polyprenyl-1,4-benzoquinol methylase